MSIHDFQYIIFAFENYKSVLHCLHGMLQNTFLHIPGIGRKTESELWKKGILNWEELRDAGTRFVLDAEQSIEAFRKENYGFFRLPDSQNWRAYKELKDKCCFVDIETTGLCRYTDDITLIGLHDSRGTKIFMNGEDLEEFQKEISKYEMVVTFNGKSFDIPFISQKFRDFKCPAFHVDLRWVLRELGYSGGLKSIETQLGMQREEEIKGLSGYDAVRLWYRYKRGDDQSLELLKTYLHADVENLRNIMDFSYQRMKEKNFYPFID